MIAWWTMSATYACDEVAAEVRAARDQLLSMEMEAAAAGLGRARGALSCDVVDPTEVALLFLVDGAFRSFGGDEAGARRVFAAAARVAPDVWIVDLGPDLSEVYRASRTDAVPPGRLTLSGVPEGAEVRIDGAARGGLAFDGGGPHVVQVLLDGSVWFGTQVDVAADTAIKVPPVAVAAVPTPAPVTPKPAPRPKPEPVAPKPKPEPVAPPPKPEPVAPRPEPEPKPKPEPVAPKPKPDPGPPKPAPTGDELGALYAAIGGEVVLGEAATGVGADGSAVAEPATKAAAPLDLGLRLRFGPGWVRGTAGVAPGTGLLYATSEGAAVARVAWGGAVAGGVGLAHFDLGASVGLWLPGRRTVRLVAGVPFTPLFGLEARVGFNTVEARGLEPAGALSLVLDPVWGRR